MARGVDTLPIYAQMPPGGFTPQPGGVTPITPPGTGSPPVEIAVQPPPYAPEGPVRETNLLKESRRLPLIAVVIVVVLVVVAFAYIRLVPHPSRVTTTTTVQQASLNQINSCMSISSSGNYTFASNIVTNIQSGACINVSASGVSIDCMGHSLTGSGPYSGVRPFSSGIATSGNRTTIEDCAISNFSYGIYAGPASDLKIYNNNVSSNYMANIYLNGMQGSSVYQNRLARATSRQGSLYLANGSDNNQIYNNTINNDLSYGIRVNSTGNLFYDNYITGTPSGFYCSATGGLSSSNKAHGNDCFNNTGCSFVACSGFNLVTNISSIALTSNVNGCGSINSPGVYTLQGPINMGAFVNVTNPLASASGISCIYIRSSGVTLNCAGNRIFNATTAILASGRDNISVSNCRITASAYGVSFTNVSYSKIFNTSASGGIDGIELQGSSVDFLTNVTARDNSYGIFMAGSSTDTVSRFTASNNSYGLYLSNSTGNIFNGGRALNNSNIDVYASADSASPSYNLMTTTSCGVTNAAWASCAAHTSTNLLYTPVNSCSIISRSGNYLLATPLIGSFQNCFQITASNVQFSCNGNHIGSSVARSSGYIFSVSGASNVTIRGCDLANFEYGVNATNSRRITVTNVSDRFSGYGIAFSNVSESTISSDYLNNTVYYGVLLSGSRNNTIHGINVSYDYGPGAAIQLSNSTRNQVVNNSGYSSYYGISLAGASQNNTIENNNMFGSDYYDYICSPLNTPINAEHGGVNYGANRQGCNWMAVIPIGYSGMQCRASFASNYLTFSTDQLYTIGSTCFTVYGNATTLDCQGHSVIATNGGTLMALNDSKGGSTIKNCVLRGFTAIVASRNSQFNLINDTIYTNSIAGYVAPQPKACRVVQGVRSHSCSDPVVAYSPVRNVAYVDAVVRRRYVVVAYLQAARSGQVN